MAAIKKLEDLQIWVKAKAVAVVIYKITANEIFTKDQSLTDQVRRAAISVSSNIAEGYERNGNKEFIQFLSYAKGSCGEIKSQWAIAFELGYVSLAQKEEVISEINEISRMIGGLIDYLKTSDRKGAKFEN